MMNIYEEIEDICLKKNFLFRALKFFDKVTVITLITFILAIPFCWNLITLTFLKSIVISVFAIVFVFICSIFYFLYISKNNLKSFDKNISFLEKVRLSFKEDAEGREIPFLVDALKRNNVKSKESLELIILHYRGKQSVKSESGDFYNYIALVFSATAFLMSGYSIENDTFPTYMFLMLFIAFMFAGTLFIVKKMTNYYFNFNDEFYSRVENNLVYIYLNFEKLFHSKSLNKKRKGIIKRITSIIKKK